MWKPKMLLAKAYIGNNDLDAAKQLLSRMASGQRGLGEVHFLLGDIFAIRHLYTHAADEYEAGLLHSDALVDRFPELKALCGKQMEACDKVEMFQQVLAKIRENSDLLDENRLTSGLSMFPRLPAGQLDPAMQIVPDPDNPDGFIAFIKKDGSRIQLTPAQAYLAKNMQQPYSEVVLIAKCNARFQEHLTVQDLNILVSRLKAAGMIPGTSATPDQPAQAAPAPQPGTSLPQESEDTHHRFPNHWSLGCPQSFLDRVLPAVACVTFS